MALYRKYRPQTLDDLVGQTAVKQILKSAINSQKLAHAYLFCGPRGTGKTSTARILAKIVNCEKQATGSRQQAVEDDLSVPCNECATCVSITDGSNMDVIEMDAASNRGIEDIRSLRENIKLAPTSSRKKVYIVDEVHMLTGEAFNALLKTLEEPPAHVLFILATTEAHKIPQTILSRVQKLDFKLASVEELVESLKKIAEKDKIKITPEALLSLAKKAQGSFRDAHKILDQLASFGEVDQRVIEENLGSSSLEGVVEVLGAVALGNGGEALLSLNKQLEKGSNIKELNLLFLDVLRMCLLIKNGLGEQLVKKEVEGEGYQVLVDLAAGFDLIKLISTISNFQKSYEESRFVSIPSLPLEVAVVASSMVGVLDSKISQKDSCLPAGRSETLRKPERSEDQTNQSSDTSDISGTPSHSESFQNKPSSSDIIKLQEKWIYVLETVRQYNFSLEALLRSAKILQCDETNLILEVPYSFHQRIIEAPKSRDVLESIFSDILGRSIKISATLGKRKVAAGELANVEVAEDDEIVRMAAEIFNSDSVN